MGQPKKKLTLAQKAAKKKRQQEYMTVIINGKQKRVKKPATIDGIDVEEFIIQNADPIWLHQNEMWEYMELVEDNFLSAVGAGTGAGHNMATDLDDTEIPF